MAYIGFVMLLFFLSMICERVSDFLKNFLSESNNGIGYAIGRKLGLGDLLTKGPLNGLREQKRTYRILKINIWCGFVVAWALNASIFRIIGNISDPSNAIGWKNVIWLWDEWDWSITLDWLIFLVGCFATGCFISLGSKFWHDLLDILLQIKNYRRLIADPATYRTDNIKAFDRLIEVYESEIIHGAYTLAKEQWKKVDDLVATALKFDEEGYYIEVTLEKDTAAVQPIFEYTLENGDIKSVRVHKVIAVEEIVAHSINLGDTVNHSKARGNKGTLGCLIKRSGKQDVCVLTCYHNVVAPRSGFIFSPDGDNDVELSDGTAILNAKTSFAVRDHEIDAAILTIDSTQLEQITNQVPGLGEISGIRDDLKKSDLKKQVTVMIHGAVSGFQQGIVTGVYCDVKIRYSDGKHEFINLISISNGGKAISARGDSGACVLDVNRELVGLIVGGNAFVSYAIPASTLFKKLSLTLITN